MTLDGVKSVLTNWIMLLKQSLLQTECQKNFVSNMYSLYGLRGLQKRDLSFKHAKSMLVISGHRPKILFITVVDTKFAFWVLKVTCNVCNSFINYVLLKCLSVIALCNNLCYRGRPIIGVCN